MASPKVALLLVLAALMPAACALAGEADVYTPQHFETQPGICFYLFQDDLLWSEGLTSVVHHATTDCVTPPVAVEFSFPPLDLPAGVIAYDLDQVLPRTETTAIPADAVGISFWVKGDGSKGTGVLELRNDYRQPGAAYTFALEDRSWRFVTVEFSQFTPAVDVSTVSGLCFGLGADSNRPASYIIDALCFVKTLDAGTQASPPAAARGDSVLDIPVRPSPSACTYNKGALARARQKVRSGGTLKWVAYGDSVTVPVQMWNVPEGLLQTKYGWYAAAARSLEKEYGCTIEIAVNAVGGRQLNEEFGEIQASLDGEKPDVLLMLAGDTIANYDVLMPQVVSQVRAAGAELLVVIPTYEPTPLRVPAFDYLRRYCIENNIACADARTGLLGIPEAFWGDTTANPSHPNPLGHRIIGQVVSEMFR